MIENLPITATIFVVIGVGYLSVRLRIFTPDDMAALGKFVVKFALPALILRAVSANPIGDFANVNYLAAVLIGTLAVFFMGYFWSRTIAAENALASTFSAMGMSCPNSGFIGFPILLIALPDVASNALALNMIIENLVMIPLVLFMAEYARGGETPKAQLFQQITKKLVSNPIVLALVIGLAISVSGLSLPALIARPIDMFASASAALSLAVIGGTPAMVPIRRFDASVLRIAMGKLIVHPLAVGLSLFAMSLMEFGVQNDMLAAAAIILAATPVMSVYPIIA